MVIETKEVTLLFRKRAFRLALAGAVIAFVVYARFGHHEAIFETFKISTRIADSALTFVSIIGMLWAVHLVLTADAANAKYVAILKCPGMEYLLYLPNAQSALGVYRNSNERTVIMPIGSSTRLDFEEIQRLAKLEEDEGAKLE
jgi:hypothetical protein